VKRPVLWLIRHIPLRLLAEPERFTLALCFTVIGFDAIFLGAPSSVLGGIPKAHLFVLETGFAFLFGGCLKLVGLWRKRVWQVRLAAAFIIMGCVGMVIGVFVYGQEGDYPIAIVYMLFAVTYLLRLLSSTAARYRLHRGNRE
jgi:hypothetical protein